MPTKLPEDEMDPDLPPRYLHGLLPKDHPLYPVALRLIMSGNTRPSQEAIGQHIRMWLRYLRMRGIDPAVVTPDDVLEWKNRLAHLRPATQESYLGAVRRLYERAVYDDVVRKNPAKYVKVGQYEPPHVPGIGLETVNAIMRSLRNEMRLPDRRLVAARDYFIFTLCLTFGPRSAAIRRLTLGDIHSENDPPTITLLEKFRRYRSVRMPRRVAQVLAMYRGVLEEALGRELDPSDALVIPMNSPTVRSLAGTPPPLRPMTAAALGYLIRQRLLDAGIGGDKLGPHRLRKTFATLAHRERIDGTDIKEALGHRRLSITYDHYIQPEQNLEYAPGDDLPLDWGEDNDEGSDDSAA